MNQLKINVLDDMEKNRKQLLDDITESLQNLNIDALEIFDRLFIQPAKHNELYSIKTPLERIEEIRAKQKERELEENELKELKHISRYHKNKTMKMLGHQYYDRWLGCEGAYKTLFDDLKDAYEIHWNFDIAADSFTLGLICGKREERKRKNYGNSL